MNPNRLLMSVVLIALFSCLPFGNSHATTPTSGMPEVFSQLGHSVKVNAVAFSPSGRYLVSGGGDRTLKLWEVATGREIRTFKGHSANVSAVVFSPDGRNVVSGSWDNTLKLWDVTAGREVRTFKGHSKGIESVAISPDGHYVVSGGWNNTLILWEVATGRKVRTFRGHSDPVRAVSFSPDGRYLASGSSDQTLKLWDVTAGREVRTFKGHTDTVWAVAFSPDGRYAVSGSSDKTLKLWDVATALEVRTFSGHIVSGHSFSVNAVAFSPDGQYVLSAGYKTLKLWDVTAGREVRTFAGHSDFVEAVAFSPDGRYVVSGARDSDCTLKLWHVATGREIRTFTGHTSRVKSVAFSPEGQYVVSASRLLLKLWDVTAGREVRTFAGHSDFVEAVAFSPDGRYAVSGSSDETLKLWDVATGREVNTFKGHTSNVFAVSFSPDGRYVVSGSMDKTLKLWEVATGREVNTFKGHTSNVSAVSFSPDGRYVVSGSELRMMKLWDVATGREVRTFKRRNAGVSSVAFSPDGQYIMSGGSTLKLWDVTAGREVRTFKRRTGGVSSVAFSPDGLYVVSGSWDSTLNLWDVAAGRIVRTFRGHNSSVESVAFSADGRHVVSGSKDGTTRLWDVESGKEVIQLISFTDGEWIAITPEGYYKASANGDQHLNVRIGNEVYGIDQFRETFYQPRIVEAALRSGDAGQAMAQVLGSGSQPTVATMAQIQPPIITLQAPTDGTALDVQETLLAFSVKDLHKPIKQISVEVNGRRVNRHDVRGLKVVKDQASGATLDASGIRIPNGRKRLDLKLPLQLEEGDNHIEIVASNGFSEATRTLRLSVSLRQQKANTLDLPNLWILAIGINKYTDTRINELSYAVADAHGIVNAFQSQQGRLFRQVHSRLITDRSALKPTYETIVDNLDYLRQAAHNDVVLLFMAGHGINDERGEFYFLPRDAVVKSDGRIKKSRAVSWEVFEETMDLPSKKIILADTCHSEGLSGRRTRGVDNDALARALKEARAVVFTSSTGRELSQEGPEWGHGVFSHALIKGLEGAADLIPDNKISMKELDTYVSEAVPKLTQGAQHPITHTPEGYISFPVALIP